VVSVYICHHLVCPAEHNYSSAGTLEIITGKQIETENVCASSQIMTYCGNNITFKISPRKTLYNKTKIFPIVHKNNNWKEFPWKELQTLVLNPVLQTSVVRHLLAGFKESDNHMISAFFGDTQKVFVIRV
jgi:hypothetical protein